MSNSLAVIEGEYIEESALAVMQQPEELVQLFLKSLDIRPNSKATYERQLREFVAWLQESSRQLQQLLREDILAYKEHLIERMSSRSVSGYLTAVRRLFAWLEAERIYPNVAAKVKGPKRPKGHAKDSLSPEQLRESLSVITEDKSQLEGLRDFALFNLMARAGLRDIEVRRARVGDIRYEQGQAVLYVHGKGRDNADEFVLLMPEALEPVQAYLKARGQLKEDAPLFASSSRRNYGKPLTTRSISRIVKQALLRAGLDSSKLTAHSLRHTAITLALIGGATIQQAQAMARHASPETTMVYAHNLNRIEQGAERFISF